MTNDERSLELDRGMTLLRTAARIDPMLRDAVSRVEDELRALRESHNRLMEAAQRVKATLAWGLADSRVEEGTAAFLRGMVVDLSEAIEAAAIGGEQ